MTSIRRQLVALLERGAIPGEQVERAVRLSGLYPPGRAWSVFLDRLLLWLGCLALPLAVDRLGQAPSGAGQRHSHHPVVDDVHRR
ncbi:hypothetical protein [Litchfieldella qijiaojingensis]|uniref:hypothetical protein n=1 Tax=Litchfieldella qijiaojingensis TaxID=980347 RepID=UPI001E3E3C95|nr:hypothetical protein [Halomonas qijiaojingensis]